MKLKKLLAILLSATLALSLLSACDSSDSSSSSDLSSSSSSSENGDDSDDKSATLTHEVLAFSADGSATVTTQRYFTEHTDLTIACPEGASVYYTTDGSEPTKDSKLYEKPVRIRASSGDFPKCMVLKAKAYYSDGTESEVVTHTMFAQKGIDNRFETLVFSISADPAVLTDSPDGILYGENYEQRGRESEREVYVEALNPDGSTVFSQGAGVRVYGAASRASSIKSLKLFARKEYDPNHGKFKIDSFGTIGADGEVMNKYDKLVLRNYGNDFQFAFIRDEFNQRLAAQAGYTDVEAVVPAVVYINGEYYGLVYLHESYCNDFFTDKYGAGEGSYEVIEGTEAEKKTDDDDEETVAAATEFNEKYNELAYSDLTDDANYQKLCEFMDVENYLQNYAFNIYVNNYDWPQNNYKCYRYYAADGEEYGEGAMDGRWRFLFHDTDFSLALYEQTETNAGYNNLKQILKEGSDRYSPLFANLMNREDCKQYFLDEMERLMDGALSYENMSNTLDTMNAERYNEMQFYFKHLEGMKSSDSSIWIWYDEYLKRTENIRSFANRRRVYMERFLKSELGLPDDYFDK